MNKILALILVTLRVSGAVAVSGNLLATPDGNVWEVKDELTVGENYVVLFDTLGDDIVENDEVVRVWGWNDDNRI